MSAPLVRLPGMLLDHRLWSGLPPREGVLDLPLRGSTLDEAVEAVLAAAPPRFALAGLSLGGVVAMALVARAPERVRRLVLLGCNGRAPTRAQRDGWDVLETRTRAGELTRITPDTLWPGLVAASRRDDPVLAELVAAMAADTGETAFLDQLGVQRSRVDLRPGLASYPGPATVVVGSADALCSLEMHVEIADALPAAELVVLPGVGHLAPLEAPDEVDALLHPGGG
ncbi:alpha/beta fold hydrolase [Auraticoccus monumenti]|uniref:Pimeloyl-ACP methyl ester carboxylesterase n=1 Tax=Auraticoccus monumenti TaxID=675864 RepID=A0A1G6S504_9ACTN|nr:alpha/beta fold hydrolase [Auraticoccus monumenti]SDD11754.1 Pimeloyl-ACP methyl ester carboxylesterase [Auraticoccus monumenti]